MEQKARGGISLPPLTEVVVVVRDLEKVMEFYSAIFGLGPFQITESTQEGVLYRGRPISYKMRTAVAQVGQQVRIRLAQVVEGETIHTEILRRKGEGVSQLVFYVDDFDEKVAELAKHGVKPIVSIRRPDLSVAYLDTENIGGAIIELVQMR